MILSIECSAKSVGCSLTNDKKIIAEYFINNKLTHSSTLMPMIENMLLCSQTSFSDIDKIAISAGPGSFTGIRIGICTVKGLAFANNIPVIAVSTLEAIANSTVDNAIICAVMDARCNQVYNAIFRKNQGLTTRLCEDRAISINELYDKLLQINEPIILAGDGALICFEAYKQNQNILLPPENLIYQSAYGVAISSIGKDTINAADLAPIYLRPPSAQPHNSINLNSKGEKQ